MAVNSNTWSDIFTKKFSDYSGYVLSLDDAMRVLNAYEVATTSTFTVIKQTKGFGSTSMARNLKGIYVIYISINVLFNEHSCFNINVLIMPQE